MTTHDILHIIVVTSLSFWLGFFTVRETANYLRKVRYRRLRQEAEEWKRKYTKVTTNRKY